MSQFLTPLVVQERNDVQWLMQRPLAYWSDIANQLIVVPAGFVTDFASVPRLPFVYLLAAGTAHMAAVVHDFLYTSKQVSREIADKVLLEAMEVTGIPAWRRYPMYLAVRAFGGSHW